jgi:hypothetical protein
MHKAKLKRAVALVVLSGVCGTAALLFYTKRMKAESVGAPIAQNPQLTKTVEVEWETSFFSALEERTSKINLPRLKGLEVTKDQLEMRYWYDGSPGVINGFVIRRIYGNWSGLGVRQARDRWPSTVLQNELGAPKSGWDSLWKRLTDAGMLVLPDGDQTKCAGQILDGGGVVIEVVSNKTYRTYRYSNPNAVTCDEAKHMRLIDSIIAEEFNPHSSPN